MAAVAPRTRPALPSISLCFGTPCETHVWHLIPKIYRSESVYTKLTKPTSVIVLTWRHFINCFKYLLIKSTDNIPDAEVHYNPTIDRNETKVIEEKPVSSVTEPPKTSTGISSSGRDAGVVAGIVVAVISGVLILGALIAVVMYRHYVHRNVTSMNFDNPVYRKTTEDQFALEKNGYAPGGKLYPSTVGEEAQEPLNTIGTNDFV